MNNLVDTFSKNAGYNVSTKYKAINTAGLVDEFSKAGFSLYSSSAARVKNAEREGYQKHLFTFRHADLTLKNVNDSIPQIILKNSYDGSSSLQVMLGVYRLVCSNGLIVGSTWASYRIRHVGANAVQAAVQAALEVSKQADNAADIIQRMQGRVMSQNEMNMFADNAAKLILPETAISYDLDSLLTPRRSADTGSDLWSVYNRVQENVIRGGFRYTTIDAANRTRSRSRRSVRAIDANVRLNKGLWALAEQLVG